LGRVGAPFHLHDTTKPWEVRRPMSEPGTVLRHSTLPWFSVRTGCSGDAESVARIGGGDGAGPFEDPHHERQIGFSRPSPRRYASMTKEPSVQVCDHADTDNDLDPHIDEMPALHYSEYAQTVDTFFDQLLALHPAMS
jgi:hypothetical protein